MYSSGFIMVLCGRYCYEFLPLFFYAFNTSFQSHFRFKIHFLMKVVEWMRCSPFSGIFERLCFKWVITMAITTARQTTLINVIWFLLATFKKYKSLIFLSPNAPLHLWNAHTFVTQLRCNFVSQSRARKLPSLYKNTVFRCCYILSGYINNW